MTSPLTVLSFAFALALAACSSETIEALPPTPDAGLLCESSWVNAVTAAGTSSTLTLDRCSNGKSYRLDCDAAQCTCKADGVVTAREKVHGLRPLRAP